MSDRVLLSAVSAGRRWLAAAVVTAAVSTAAGLLLPATLGRALDAAVLRRDRLTVSVVELSIVLAAIAIADVAGQLAGTAGAAGTTA